MSFISVISQSSLSPSAESQGRREGPRSVFKTISVRQSETKLKKSDRNFQKSQEKKKKKTKKKTLCRGPSAWLSGPRPRRGNVCRRDKSRGESLEATAYHTHRPGGNTQTHPHTQTHTAWVCEASLVERFESGAGLYLTSASPGAPAAVTSDYFSICLAAGRPSSQQITDTGAGKERKEDRRLHGAFSQSGLIIRARSVCREENHPGAVAGNTVVFVLIQDWWEMIISSPVVWYLTGLSCSP